MYADNLTIPAKINSEDDKKQLQLELNNVCKWVYKWQLKINYTRSVLCYTLVGKMIILCII